MKKQYPLLAALCGILAVGSVFAADPAPSAVSPEADRLLRAVCANLSATKAYSFKAEVWEDAVVFGHKVSTTKTVEAQVRRPDRVQIEIRSPLHSRGFWYDGQSLTLLDRVHNLYGTVPVPETIDKVLDAANDKFTHVCHLPLQLKSVGKDGDCRCSYMRRTCQARTLGSDSSGKASMGKKRASPVSKSDFSHCPTMSQTKNIL